MANTLKFGNGQWYGKKDTILAYNSENNNYKPLPFSFDRDSSATRVNKEGLIETVGSGEPRIDYKDDSKGALLLEPSRSNLVTYSEDFTQGWADIDVIIDSNQIISPDGTLNASKFIPTSSGTQHFLRFVNTLSAKKTFSFYAKKGEYDRVASYFEGTNTSIIFDLTNGTTLTNDGLANPSDFSIEEYPNGWYRCSSTQDGATNCDIFSVLGTSSTMTGDGISGLYIYGAQLEQGSYATSYIPTRGSIGTRVAESCVQTNINTSIINSSYPFTIYVQSIVIASNPYVISFLNNSSSSQSYIIALSGNQVYFGARANGTTENLFSGVTLTDGQTFKAAVTMESATSGKLSVNGNIVSKTNFTSQGANVNINDLLLGQLRTVSDTGHRLPIKEVKLYNTTLTDQELINLTKI